MGMRHALHITFALSLTAGCSTDLIEHDAGPLGSPDAAADAGHDAGATDGGDKDAGATDAGASQACELQFEVSLELDPTEVGRTSTKATVLTNVGLGTCEPTLSIEPAGTGISLFGPVTPATGPGDNELIRFEFSPSTPGDHEAHLVARFGSNPADTVQLTRLRGYGFLTDSPSLRTMTYRVRNATGEDRYLVLEGRDCRGLDPSVPTQLSFQCGCECPPPPDPGPTRLVRIPPGQTYSVVWDTRRLFTWDVELECGPGFTETEVRGALGPVPNGTYPTRLAYMRTVPAYCNPSSTPDEYECDPVLDIGPVLPNPISPLCDTDGFAQVSAVVDDFDQQVMVDITN